jgi:hypothetical protein
MNQIVATIIKVNAGGRTHSGGKHMFFVEIEFKVGDVSSKKDISDALRFRFNNNIPATFIEEHIPPLIDGIDCFVRAGSGRNAFVPTGHLYDFIKKEVYKKWNAAGGWEGWKIKRSKACV